MRILVLGGTVFLGRWFVQAALDAGHDVTLFHRGRHGADLFPEARRLIGDRATDLGLLDGGSWDAVVDTSGYLPRAVRASCERLRSRVGRYLFVSSVSVYADADAPTLTEDSSVAQLADPSSEDVARDYGALKAACELVVREVVGEARSTVVRPTLIVGPWDPTDRFTYWPVRFAEGGDLLVPDRPSQPVQVIDARDLAYWMLLLLEQEVSGVFNAAGPAEPLTLGDLWEAFRAEFPGARPVPVSEGFLSQQGVQCWTELPLWIASEARADGTMRADSSRAVSAGLTFRPIVQTARDTVEWHGSQPARPWAAGLTAERERRLLELWGERRGSV
ncbi:MAG: NAD-dependent epimerase/dehydratase family protein [Armatimonadetes bacterium]|nr:NAD-dependent epimerase/dehydratase family protein [Armatimonadota bacterium]MCA1996191.1 NAD-dependent epimerase/dehydratase family protein [Armatimonadota bacterium]